MNDSSKNGMLGLLQRKPELRGRLDKRCATQVFDAVPRDGFEPLEVHDLFIHGKSLFTSIQNVPVCTFKTSPCVPAPRAHVETHVRVGLARGRFACTHGGVLNPHTVFSRFFSVPQHTHTHTKHTPRPPTTPRPSVEMSIEYGFGVRTPVRLCLVIRVVIQVVIWSLSSCETLPSSHLVESQKHTNTHTKHTPRPPTIA